MLDDHIHTTYKVCNSDNNEMSLGSGPAKFVPGKILQCQINKIECFISLINQVKDWIPLTVSF